MSVKNENAAAGESVVLSSPETGGVYADLFAKINLSPVSQLRPLDIWQDAQAWLVNGMIQMRFQFS